MANAETGNMSAAQRFRFYFHPLASFCWKPLIALYENAIEFEPVLVDLADPTSAAAFRAVWPLGKFPVLRDEVRGHTVAESTILIEYLDTYCAGPVRLVPADADLAWQARMWDRFLDFYVHEPMQRIVGDSLRPDGGRDATGVAQAREQLQRSYDILEARMGGCAWLVGDAFGLADCAAAPALFYANTVEPLSDTHPHVTAYLERLMRRPSFARVLEEAEPCFGMFPLDPKPTRALPVVAANKE